LRRDIAWKVACGCALTTRASTHRAGVLAQPHPHLAQATARLRGGPPGGGGNRGAQGPHRHRARVRPGDRVHADRRQSPRRPTGLELLAREERGLEGLGDSGYGSGHTRACRAARCAASAPPPRVVAGSACTRTRTRCARAALHHHPQLQESYRAGGRWWNARSSRWSLTAADHPGQ
jgi:hypothetical protein